MYTTQKTVRILMGVFALLLISATPVASADAGMERASSVVVTNKVIAFTGGLRG